VTATPHDAYASLRRGPFRWFIISLLTMTVAAQIEVIVVSWQIYGITHDPLSLGLIGLAEALPFLSAALFAGHIADRLNRQRISIVGLFVLVLCALTLLWISLVPSLLRTGVWPFYLVIGISGLARSFLHPARNALGAEIVPRELYHNAIAWRSSTWQSAAVLGPAVGGLLYGFGGPKVAYVVQAVLMVCAFFAFTRIAYHPPARAAAVSDERISQSLTAGLRFVWSQPVLLGALTLDLFSVLLGGAEALLPIFADQILHVGPQGLGVLRAAPAAGAVLMSIFLAHRPPFTRAGRTLLLAVGVFAICIVGFGLSRSVVLSTGLLLISGMADNVSVLIRSTLIQVLTPTEMLGRVSAVNSIFIGSSNELGAFESGVAARLLGTVPSVVLGGLASLAVVGAIAATIPKLRRMRVIGAPE